MVLALYLVLLSAGFSFGQAKPAEADASDLGKTSLHTYGPVDDLVGTLVKTYGPFDLKAHELQQVPPNIKGYEVTFPEDLWVLGYRVEMVDASGNQLSQELQCHTFLGTSVPVHDVHEQVVGIFSDGYTSDIQLPPGFGIFFKKGEPILWTPMFNNRNPEGAQVDMKLSLDVIRANHLPPGVTLELKPLTTTFHTIRETDSSDLYFVPPGKDIRETTFKLPFVGKIHLIGTHIHPYGRSIELINVTRNRSVWKAVGRRDRSGRLVKMPVYVNSEGYDVGADDQFKLVAVYENPTEQPVDAMAGVFILYSPAETAP